MGFEDDLRRAEGHVAEARRGAPAEMPHYPLKGGRREHVGCAKDPLAAGGEIFADLRNIETVSEKA